MSHPQPSSQLTPNLKPSLHPQTVLCSCEDQVLHRWFHEESFQHPFVILQPPEKITQTSCSLFDFQVPNPCPLLRLTSISLNYK